jgi:cytochrome c-type biogenesis protein CcmH
MFFLSALFLTALAILCVLLPLASRYAGHNKIAGKDLSGERYRRRMVALAALIFIPVMSFALYEKLGSPDYSDMPFDQRREASLDKADFSVLLARTEERLQKDKNDAQGWEILAQSYRSLHRLDDSVRAYRELVRLKGNDMPALLGLGEAMVEAQGQVSIEAKNIFMKVLQKDAKHPEALYFLARAKIESGNKQAGLRDLKALLEASPKNAPWRNIVQDEINKNE